MHWKPTFLAVCLLVPAMVAAQTRRVPPNVQAERLHGSIQLDGIPDEPAWAVAPACTAFAQSDPVRDGAPSQRSEVRVLYDDAAIYVGAWLWDTSPDSIVAELVRRDVPTQSDRFVFYLDPYHDKRSGYFFMINAAGVLRDGTLMNDGWDDDTWDGIWEGKVHRDAVGWSLEMRIPFSQLRFKADQGMVWGVNFRRSISRLAEQDWLVYRPRGENRFVSLFPELRGLSDIRPARAVELVPYVTTRADYLPRIPGDPFRNGSHYDPRVGLDLRTSVGGNLTLNTTVNPDFGQVEVDPAVVNLSDVETYYAEKRPFFVEGRSVFNCGNNGATNYWNFNWNDPAFFYTRRVGRSPQGSLGDHDHANVPAGTRILGAGKLTGQLGPGWKFGVMQALTAREFAELDLGGARTRQEVEPLTHYSVTRLLREFPGSRQGLGLMTMTTIRDLGTDALRADLNGNSQVAALDGWTFLDRKKMWVVSGWTALTRASGSRERITALQRSSQHYFQRPDARNGGVDSLATSLNGYGARFWLNKESGNTFVNAALGRLSHGFDVNDLGFFNYDTYTNAHVVAGYNWNDPRGWRQNAWVNIGPHVGWSDGSMTTAGVFQNFGLNTVSQWSLEMNQTWSPRRESVRRTRGGPRMALPGGHDVSASVNSDSRNALSYSASTYTSSAEDRSWAWGASLGATWKPRSNLNFTLSPGFDRSHEDAFYVTTHADPSATGTFGARYVFAQLDQNSVSASVRANVTFSPSISFQLYAQPLIATGHYFGYKELARADSRDFRVYGQDGSTYDPVTGIVDPDGGGPASPFALGDQNFRYLSLRGNAVFRWEYWPGSALFVVWNQSRSDFSNTDGEFRLHESLTDLSHVKPDNVFMLKLTRHFDM